MDTTQIAKQIISKYNFTKDEVEFLTPKIEDLLIQFVSVTVLSEIPDKIGDKIVQLVEQGKDHIDIVELLENEIPNFYKKIEKTIKEFLDQFSK